MTNDEIEIVARAIHKAKGYDKWPEPMCTQCEELARIAITALDQHREGKGLVVVPKELTEEMEDAGEGAIWHKRAKPVWDAMLAASPIPKEEKP